MGIFTDIPPTKEELDEVDRRWKKHGKIVIIICSLIVFAIYAVSNLT